MDISNICKTPITEENPCGVDITYDPKFEELQKEIDKLSVVSQAGEDINWNKIIETASEITKNHSKHILVCVYLSFALIKTQGFKGAVYGSELIKDLISNFWNNMYPPAKRKKGRINAINWWFNKLDLYLKELIPDENIIDNDAIALKKNIQKIDSLLAEKLGNSAPVLRPLIQKIERIEADIPKKEEPKPKVKEIKSEEKSADIKEKIVQTEKPVQKIPESGTIFEITDIKDALKTINQGTELLIKAANFIFNKDLSNPQCYKIFRFYIWSSTNQLPMLESDNKTLIPAPDSKIKSGIELLFKSNDFENIIITSEKTLRNYIFWLDLCRFSIDAMTELGRKFEKAKITIESETIEFIKKLPGIENLSFSDGTPFADNETKAWLKKLDKNNQSSAVFPLNKKEGDNTEAEINELIQKKDMEKAFLLLENKILQAKSLREKLIQRISLVNILMEIGKPELGLAHINEIISIIDSYKIDILEPELAVAGFSAAYSIIASVNNDDNNKEKKDNILNKINILSPSTAYRITNNP